jgi:predicted PurR-regulated permease PerM
MPSNRFFSTTFLFVLAVLGYLTYRIMLPFLDVIAWAVVLSILFFPVYVFILKYVRLKSAASLMTVILILLVVIGPFTYVAFMLLRELKFLASQMDENNIGSVQEIIQAVKSLTVIEKIREYTGIENLMSETAIRDSISKIGKVVIEHLSLRLTNIFLSVIDFVLIIFSTFFLLKDGPGFLARTRDYMPFSEVHKERLDTQIRDIIVSTVFGGVVIALVQGVLGGIGFYFSGLESPVVLGVIMSIMSFVPVLGAFSVWGPASAYLFFHGDYLQATGLFIFGALVISSVDNILKPLIIGSRTKIHTIIILFSVLGGLKFFGMIGLIMGPLITAIFISVFEIFRSLESHPGAGQ